MCPEGQSWAEGVERRMRRRTRKEVKGQALKGLSGIYIN